MSVAKRDMHPRNVFRQPPDYTELAIKHENFRKVCNLELNGKVSIDYRNESALRALTQVLLLEYFGLNVDFAPESLVPTLPLRLNYILWLEDLLAPHNIQNVRGIDIGCGSACIYSLLAARKNQWHMLALETNDANIKYAKENVKSNKLENYIQVYAQHEKQKIFENYFESEQEAAFQFCLCNPPFYDSTLPDPFNAHTRNPHRRPPPHNVRTGGAEELTCAGGEVKFVQRIIEESQRYKHRVLIYTSMLGHKQSLVTILQHFQVLGITNVSNTEFCQGNTTRWGIAWSFGNQLLTETSSNKTSEQI